MASSGSGAADLLTTFHHVARSEDPSEALHTLVRDCVSQTSAARGDLYLLDLSESRLALAFSTAPEHVSGREKAIPLTPSALRRTDWRFRKVFKTNTVVLGNSAGESETGSSRELFVPITRDRACLGMIRLVPNVSALSSDDRSSAQLAAQLAAFLVEKKYTLQLLTVIEKRINYQQPRDQFLDELMLLAAEASGFPYIVLRELDDEHTALECIRSYGYAELPAASLHLAPLSNYPLFEQAVVTRATQVIAENASDSDSVVTHVAQREELQRVVIVPILVGETVYGTASFAVACDHHVTTLEQRGLEAIANCLGGAIANYRNVGLAHEVFFERAKSAAAFTTVDVAQAARHEARNFIHNAQTNMTTLSKMVGKSPLKGKVDVSSLIDDVFNDLNRVDIALDKIKAITKPVDHVRETYPLDKLWQEAIELVGGRLRAMNVRYAVRGDVSVECVPDLLRHGFLQLVLNSIDSFKETGNKRGHTISVSIEDSNDCVLMKYIDNGIGLDVTKLMGKNFQESPRVTDIFLPGVTTKVGGSGYGLYLMRRALDAHRGSIDLLDYRNGMSFKITVAKRVNE